MEKSIEEKVEYLKEISKTMYEISTNDAILIEKLNSLPKENIDKIINDCNTKDFGSIRFVRLVIALELQKNKITMDKLEDIKNKVQNKEIEYFKQYELDKKYFVGLNAINEEKNIFTSYPSNFKILYVFFYYPIKDTIQIYINEIADFIKDKLSLYGYVLDSNYFDGVRNTGNNMVGMYFYPYELNSYRNAIQLAIEFIDGKLYAETRKGSNCKIDYVQIQMQMYKKKKNCKKMKEKKKIKIMDLIENLMNY